MASNSLSRKGRIMVVDDDFDIIYVVRRLLEKWGYSVDTFTNPLYALQKFKENPGRYSLAVLDIHMPEMSGIALAAMMQKIKPDMLVLIMTAFEISAGEMAASLPDIQTEDILRKPFNKTQICTAVKKHLQTA
ncbi:MAG TPA: response regulator [Nitrososphaera sp.]|nr:response regulator [Nitrososphaera sp.]